MSKKLVWKARTIRGETVHYANVGRIRFTVSSDDIEILGICNRFWSAEMQCGHLSFTTPIGEFANEKKAKDACNSVVTAFTNAFKQKMFSILSQSIDNDT